MQAGNRQAAIAAAVADGAQVQEISADQINHAEQLQQTVAFFRIEEHAGGERHAPRIARLQQRV